MIRRIDSKEELLKLARELEMRPDWHEPDEQDVTAIVTGTSFDNAGFWGAQRAAELAAKGLGGIVEMYVTVYRGSQPVAEVNLATLFAWATGYEG